MRKKISLNDIKKFVEQPSDSSHVSWEQLEYMLEKMNSYHEVELEPDFQREHVWTEEQQRKYVEYILRGGTSGKDIYWNCCGWYNDEPAKMQLVDGLQRITAVRKFMEDKLEVFGGYKRSDFIEGTRPTHHRFTFYINGLKTRKEVLEWYLEMNDGGTVHTEEELEKVRKLIKNE